MMFVWDGTRDRPHVRSAEKKYHFINPWAKSGNGYEKTGPEREERIKGNFMVGRPFQNTKIHMSHAFGFSDLEHIISFETDEPKDFLALAEELRETPANKFTLRGMPVYTCHEG